MKKIYVKIWYFSIVKNYFSKNRIIFAFKGKRRDECKKLNFVLLVSNVEYQIKRALSYNYSEISLIVNVNFNLNIRVIGIIDSNVC